MTKNSYLRFIVLLLIIAGCEEYEYCIEMKPCDEGVERRLACPRNLPEDKRAAIAKLYEKHIDPNIFWGRFDTNLPNDVGGAGFYTTFDTDMGQTTSYSERFRGNDNVNDTLEKIQMVADCSVDFLIGWLEHELGDDPNFADFKALSNKNVRHDFKNIVIYIWLSGVSLDLKSAGYGEIVARINHYVIERGYFAPKRMRLFGASSGVDDERILRLLREWIADKMGYSSPEIACERLGFLSDTKRAEESMKQYIRTTDLFKKAWEAKKLQENDPNAKEPQISVGEFIMHDIDLEFDLFSWSDSKIEVRLACTTQPFDTNGEWNEQANQVVWVSEIAGDDRLPTFFYASWSEPSRKYQEEHFGRVVLSDEALAEYCIWRENLDAGKGKEWDSFVLSLNPGEDLEGRLSDFRFSVDQQKGPDGQKSDLAKGPRELILAGLKSEKEDNDDIQTQADDE
ncbi:MAG: hypothetical protein ACYTAO_09970 [Planctomycetota bacterium]|jgi:hypothetical protein